MADLTSRIAIVISASSAGAVNELRDLQGQAARTGESFDTVGKKVGLAGATIKTGLVAGASALVGTGLVAFLNESVDAFTQAQDAASQFARATNATVVEAGKFTTVARAFGLEMNDLIEINAEFSKKVAQQPELLQRLGVEVAKNADGSVNMTRTLVATIDALGSMEDGLGAAQTAAELFGEEGSKQLAGFYLQGIKVGDLMDKIDFIDKSDDAKRFAASTAELSLSMEQLKIKVGAELVPALNGLVEVGTAVLGFFAEVPTEVYLAVGAVVALNIALKSQLVASVLPAVGQGLLVLTAGLLSPTLGFQLLGAAAVTAGNQMKAALVGHPVLAVLAVLATLYTAYSVGSDNAAERTKEFAARLRELEDAGASAGDALQQAAGEMRATSSTWERFIVGLQNAEEGFWENPNVIGRAIKALGEALNGSALNAEAYERALADVAEEFGAFEASSQNAEMQQRELADLIAEGVTSGEAFRTALADAGEAAQKTARDQEVLNAALAAYNGITSESIEVTQEFYDALYAAEEAQRKVSEAVKEYNAEATPENLQGVVDATRDAADASVARWEAAQQRLGIFVSESERAAQRVAAIEVLLQEPGFPPGAAARLQAEAASIVAAATREADFKIPVGFDAADIDTALTTIAAQLADPNLSPELRAQLELDQDSLQRTKANIDSLGLDGATEVKVEVTADTAQAEGAVGGLKSDLDGVAQDREAKVTVDTEFTPGGYNAVKARADFLAQTRRGLVTIDTAFTPGGYNAVKARVDYLAQNRTATITVNQVTRRSTVNVGGGDGEGRAALRSAPIPNLYANVQPNNIFKVAIDGQPLRAWIRTEVAAAQPVRAGVA